MLKIDGSQGEGGGQVLRTSLALSAITGTPFSIEQIRAKRDKPGLLRQHLTGVRAVAALCGAQVEGDALGSKSLRFTPGPIQPGTYRFEIGSAGSGGLVLQAVLPVLLVAPGPSTIEIVGGTHNDKSPPASFLAQTLLPLLGRMGPKLDITLDRYGFYPAGGGQYTVRIEPAPLVPLRLLERGPIGEITPVAVVANLPRRIGHRELDEIRAELGLEPRAGRVIEVESPGPGNVVWIEARAEHVTEVFTGFGRRGIAAERVAQEAVAEFVAWRELDVPVGEHLADQLLVPCALAGGGSFVTPTPTLHTETNAQIIRKFLDRRFSFEPVREGVVRVEVG
jgi:RNA 3'-terminal phosphate cyclase (ATP)